MMSVFYRIKHDLVYIKWLQKGVRRFNMNNPWLVTIIGGIIVIIVGYYLFEHRKEKKSRDVIIPRINNADDLLMKDMPQDALAMYNDLLKEVSVVKHPELYARIRKNEGICYTNLAQKSNKWENLTRAFLAYKEALKIYTVEKYPPLYKLIMSTMKRAKQMMGE